MTLESNPHVGHTLAILAGGQGKRLGGLDKSCLRYRGRTLLERLLDLSPLFAETLVIRDDVVPGKGAPGGVVTALVTAKTPLVLVVCCDMPFVTAEGLAPLLAVGGPACFGAEPFPAVYDAQWGHAWRAALERNPSLRELNAAAPFTRLPLTTPDVVLSINTPEDARAAGVDIPSISGSVGR